MAVSASVDGIREQGLDLAPGHLQVEITPELSTKDLFESAEEKTPQGFYDPRPMVKGIIDRLYGDEGMRGRSALDCACNNGAYLFAAKEAGAGACFGFDVRDIWIDQARFLTEHRAGPSEDMQFDVCDLYELPSRALAPVHLTINAGVLYHVPDPIRAIEITAELTKEVMLLTSACAPGWRDGAFVAGQESKTGVLSGVYGLTWYPTGPAAAIPVLRWLGFQEFRVWDWFAQHPIPNAPEVDRFLLLAFRDKSHAEEWDARGPAHAVGRMAERVVERVPPRAKVVVASGGDENLLKALRRPAEHFPQDGAGAYIDGLGPAESWALMVQLDELRARGAQYFVVPQSSLDWFDGLPQLREHLDRRFKSLASDPERDGCLLYELESAFFGGHLLHLAE